MTWDIEQIDHAQCQSPVDQIQHPRLTFPWTKGVLLGAGSVYAAYDSAGRFFAVKEVSFVDDTDKTSEQNISHLEQEVERLSQFKHENIVQYFGTEKADRKLYIFLELSSKESLASLSKKIRLTHSHIAAYTRQILGGLTYLHSMNIIHRDVQCANIFVDVQENCKFAFFGLAEQISALDAANYNQGSANWMAPEVIDTTKSYSTPADIWSLGCSVIEMFMGTPPFGDQEPSRLMSKVSQAEAPPISEDVSDDARDFIQQCLKIDPSSRPTAAALLEHKFLISGSPPEVP